MNRTGSISFFTYRFRSGEIGGDGGAILAGRNK